MATRNLLSSRAGGKALRFAEEEVRAMGRTAGGVYAIRLLGADHRDQL
jgi:DNA gyrase/topoisomerase IV subunit A